MPDKNVVSARLPNGLMDRAMDYIHNTEEFMNISDLMRTALKEFLDKRTLPGPTPPEGHP
jgi:Arc/MetJ-type ribon-helix-helix transcriptional regulator